MRKAIHDRAVSVRMLHVALGSNFWHWQDILFVLTGWTV
jgi:D-alanyl-lipoteichoic acid acyltransferase DltB (MBOAT superfamily)